MNLNSRRIGTCIRDAYQAVRKLVVKERDFAEEIKQANLNNHKWSSLIDITPDNRLESVKERYGYRTRSHVISDYIQMKTLDHLRQKCNYNFHIQLPATEYHYIQNYYQADMGCFKLMQFEVRLERVEDSEFWKNK